MKTIIFILGIVVSFNGFGQTINLSEHLKSNNFTVLNRLISEYNSDAIELDAKSGNGLAILDLIEFKTGTLSIEIKGENAKGRSFVGLAFNIQNDSTYEAIYFRPFNFIATDLLGRSHMVQYISHPIYTWNKLRAEHKNVFEAEINTPPSPDDWFLVTMKVNEEKILVYVNKDEVPVLEVNRLTDINSQKIALWTGHESSGRFRNLVVNSEQ